MKRYSVWVLTLALVGAWPVTTALAGSQRADFALLNGVPGGDTSVQCGAIKLGASSPPTAFTMFITMGNRGDLFGLGGFVRVTYRDLDFVDYPIAPNGIVSLVLSGGGTAGVDDIIKVTGVPGVGLGPVPLGPVLIGQVSILLQADAKPPLISGPGPGKAFCTTSPFSPAPF